MTTKEFFTNSEELKQLMSAARATITAPFFGNNVEEVKSVSEAYKLAKSSSGTIELTGMPVFKPEKLGLPQGAKPIVIQRWYSCWTLRSSKKNRWRTRM